MPVPMPVPTPSWKLSLTLCLIAFVFASAERAHFCTCCLCSHHPLFGNLNATPGIYLNDALCCLSPCIHVSMTPSLHVLLHVQFTIFHWASSAVAVATCKFRIFAIRCGCASVATLPTQAFPPPPSLSLTLSLVQIIKKFANFFHNLLITKHSKCN